MQRDLLILDTSRLILHPVDVNTCRMTAFCTTLVLNHMAFSPRENGTKRLSFSFLWVIIASNFIQKATYIRLTQTKRYLSIFSLPKHPSLLPQPLFMISVLEHTWLSSKLLQLCWLKMLEEQCTWRSFVVLIIHLAPSSASFRNHLLFPFSSRSHNDIIVYVYAVKENIYMLCTCTFTTDSRRHQTKSLPFAGCLNDLKCRKKWKWKRGMNLYFFSLSYHGFLCL